MNDSKLTNSELIKHIEVLKESAYTILIKNSSDFHTLLTDIKIESFYFVCNEMIKRLMRGNNNADMYEDISLIEHMKAIKAYCKKCSSCMYCPMYDNCTSVNIPEVDVKRFPRYWDIPEVT